MADGLDQPVAFERFVACVGTKFAWVADGVATSFSLVEARRLGDPGSPALPPPFSLVFEASDDRAAEQGNYRLRHAEIGTIDIFLVPIAEGETGLMFEAIFS
jgi:hypothetical protein